MKNYAKGILTGVLITSLTFSGVTFGASKLQKIDALLNSVNLTVNGKFISGENIVYKNKLYIPADKVAAAVNKQYLWDTKKGTASLDDPKVISKYNMQNPAPLNEKQVIQIDNFLEKVKAEVSIVEIMRGDDAWKKMYADNHLNTPAPAGKEYILAKVSFTLLEMSDGKAYNVNRSIFDAFSGANKEYSDTVYGVVKDDLDGDLYPGSNAIGWVPFLVDSNDTTPKMTFGRSYDGSGGIWFSLK